eukprot:15365868-Ditylum_brightwellii.AAC.1
MRHSLDETSPNPRHGPLFSMTRIFGFSERVAAKKSRIRIGIKRHRAASVSSGIEPHQSMDLSERSRIR